ncbi:Signal peptidase I T [Clostridium sp. C105KSO15]|nr:Signal peptidase I T [Clostridium sp. C105KSO15]
MAEIQKSEEVKAAETNHEHPKELSLGEEILFLLVKIAAIIFAFLLVFLFLFGLCRNLDASMSPTVKDGDLVMFYRLDKNYIASDALVLEFEGHKQVRRVVATAGDIVDITEDGLLINGAHQQEQEIYSPTQRYENGPEFPITVGEGEVFVLGDSRVNATDSRFYGVVKVKDTLGKVMMVLRWRNI